MKRILPAVVFFVLVGLVAALPAARADVNTEFSKIKNDLLAKGLSSSDINAVEDPAKTMLNAGAASADIKNIVLDFAAKGFQGTELESLMEMVNGLVKNGDRLKLAQMVIGQAADKAKASGAKGSTLMAKIQELVKQHTESVNAIKNKTSGWGSFVKSSVKGEK